METRISAVQPLTMKLTMISFLTLGTAALALSGCSITSTSSRAPYATSHGQGYGTQGQPGSWRPAGHQPAGHHPTGTTPMAPPGHPPGQPPVVPPPQGKPKPPKLNKLPKPHAKPPQAKPPQAKPGGVKTKQPKPPPHKPGGDKTKRPKPSKSHKPVGPHAKPKPLHPSMACVAAVKAAQSGLCEEALELLQQCSGGQQQAATKNVAKYCAE